VIGPAGTDRAIGLSIPKAPGHDSSLKVQVAGEQLERLGGCRSRRCWGCGRGRRGSRRAALRFTPHFPHNGGSITLAETGKNSCREPARIVDAEQGDDA
jgi:hypothetical protein